jgi:hypothetical protein
MLGQCNHPARATGIRTKLSDTEVLSFTYGLWSVCTTWRDIMSLVPQFWTRIIIFLDSPTFSLADVRSHLEWSRDLLIDVTITKNKDHDLFAERESDENWRVRNVTVLLHPHIHRCQNISYNVIHSSSLPLLSTDLHGPIPHLKQLHLESARYSPNLEVPQ